MHGYAYIVVSGLYVYSYIKPYKETLNISPPKTLSTPRFSLHPCFQHHQRPDLRDFQNRQLNYNLDGTKTVITFDSLRSPAHIVKKRTIPHRHWVWKIASWFIGTSGAIQQQYLFNFRHPVIYLTTIPPNSYVSIHWKYFGNADFNSSARSFSFFPFISSIRTIITRKNLTNLLAFLIVF